VLDVTKACLRADVTSELMAKDRSADVRVLRDEALAYAVYGAEGIEKGAHQQMQIAARLPVAVGGALMADAHHGYGLPIGGVLATRNAVIPYGVGVDIGCRMALSVFPIPAEHLHKQSDDFLNILERNTRFGRNAFDHPLDDPIFGREEFREIDVVKRLKGKAIDQIGSSGGGNHFVEFGQVHLVDEDNEFGLPTGTYLGLLSHSGSRGLEPILPGIIPNWLWKPVRFPKKPSIWPGWTSIPTWERNTGRL
jgi:tRNA-splicing ligase RtcB